MIFKDKEIELYYYNNTIYNITTNIQRILYRQYNGKNIYNDNQNNYFSSE